MSSPFWLTEAQMARLGPFAGTSIHWMDFWAASLPKSHGKPRVDDRRVLSGMIFINRHGSRRRDGKV